VHFGAWAIKVGQKHASLVQLEAAASIPAHCAEQAVGELGVCDAGGCVTDADASSSWHCVMMEAIALASVTLTVCQHPVHCGPWAIKVGQKHASSVQEDAAESILPHCAEQGSAACRGCKFASKRMAFEAAENPSKEVITEVRI
jgi:hypothetical protein